MTGLKTNERPGTKAVLRHSPDVGQQGPPGPRPDPRRRGGPGGRAAPHHRAFGRRRHRQGARLRRGERRAQRRAGSRGPVRVGLLRRRGGHAEALAAPGAGAGHPYPQADLPHHGHREPPARRAPGPAPGAARCRWAAAGPAGWPSHAAGPICPADCPGGVPREEQVAEEAAAAEAAAEAAAAEDGGRRLRRARPRRSARRGDGPARRQLRTETSEPPTRRPTRWERLLNPGRSRPPTPAEDEDEEEGK